MELAGLPQLTSNLPLLPLLAWEAEVFCYSIGKWKWPLEDKLMDRPLDHPRHALRPLNLLVVDDYEDAAETMATILRLCGHAVTTANDGESAMEAIKVLWPDAVLLDLGLPGISGNEVARRIRAMTDSRHQPVIIALTGHVGEEGQCKIDGFDHCLVKPVDPERFVGLIANLTPPPPNL
jgi:CheY-like chemotaxis protein